MESRMTKQERYRMFNSLLCLAKSLENRCTTIDLRNETCVTGKIVEVDGYMNIMVSDAALYDTDNNYQYYPILYIQARNIRNIHVPDNVSMIKAIKKQVTVEKPKPRTKQRTFKESRAKKQQAETLEMIKQMKSEKENS